MTGEGRKRSTGRAKKIEKKLTGTEYFCKKDAEAAAEKRGAAKYHILKTYVEEKRSTKEEAGCFVLISNVAESMHCAMDILKISKEQHGIEKNFGFLKDPLIVNDLFLKKTERIETLGFILVISLLIWRLIERCIRKYIKAKDITITGWDKKQTDRPTTFMMSTKFCSVHILRKDDMRWLPREITNVQKQKVFIYVVLFMIYRN